MPKFNHISLSLQVSFRASQLSVERIRWIPGSANLAHLLGQPYAGTGFILYRRCQYILYRRCQYIADSFESHRPRSAERLEDLPIAITRTFLPIPALSLLARSEIRQLTGCRSGQVKGKPP